MNTKLVVGVIVLAVLVGAGLWVSNQQAVGPVENEVQPIAQGNIFVTFDTVEKYTHQNIPNIEGTTNAEYICMAIQLGEVTPVMWNVNNIWDGCLGHSLRKDVQGVWGWSAPSYEYLPKEGYAKGVYTIAVYEERGADSGQSDMHFLGKKTFEFTY